MLQALLGMYLRGFSVFPEDASVFRPLGVFVWAVSWAGLLLLESVCAGLAPDPAPASRRPVGVLVAQTLLSAVAAAMLWPYAEDPRGEILSVSLLGCLSLCLGGLLLSRVPGEGRRPRVLWLTVGLLLLWGAACVLINLRIPRQPPPTGWSLAGGHLVVEPFNVPRVSLLAPVLYAWLFLSLPLWRGWPERFGVGARFVLLVGVSVVWPRLVALLVGAGTVAFDFLTLPSPLSLFSHARGGFTWQDSPYAWRRLAVLFLLAGVSLVLAHRALSARRKALAA
ncbi:hypothetical protein [Melittangium boletus]|uniref:hypothetical protein n=1 Tax=Melittangium boletus TaxID=83453 RepID=UPI003DA4B1E0